MSGKYNSIINSVMDDFKKNVITILKNKTSNKIINFHTETHESDNNVKMVICKVELLNIENNEEIIKQNNDIRVCIKCGVNENVNKFRKIAKTCIKCYSKTNNEKMKDKQYYKNYYLEHEGKNHKRQKNKDIIPNP